MQILFGLIRNLLGLGPAEIPLLRANIFFDKDNRASVSLEKLHPELKNPEYVRIVLHYYAKVLLNLSANPNEVQPATQLLMPAIERIARADLKEANILNLSDIADVVTLEAPSADCHKYEATLGAISGVVRHIRTEIPRGAILQHMVFSVPVLIDAVVKVLESDEIEILQRALSLMNRQYQNGENFGEVTTWERVPIQAYLNAITGEGQRQREFGTTESVCPYCGATLFGLVSACHKCGKDVEV